LSERGRRHDELVTFRVVTTAVHEVGHTLGLEHCDDPRCVMRDAEGSIRTVDTSDGQLGPICRERVEETAPRVLPYQNPE
jgi:archaemetzincin